MSHCHILLFLRAYSRITNSLNNVTRTMVEPISIIQLEHRIPYHEKYKSKIPNAPINRTQGQTLNRKCSLIDNWLTVSRCCITKHVTMLSLQSYSWLQIYCWPQVRREMMTKGVFTWVHFSSENVCRSRHIYTRNLFDFRTHFSQILIFFIKTFSIRSGKIQLLLSAKPWFHPIIYLE